VKAISRNEGRLADLLAITDEGEILCIDVIGTLATPRSPTAILIDGKGRRARIDVSDFQHPERKQ
jgi:hypothetical protein